ncbi:MAG: 16S rRNA (guanine(966)-N(2))-methyltransferase RsmD [Eubacteriales bacterium]
MRVISGSARGRRLVAPEGLDVRPTLDKVKGAIFNILQFRLEGAVVLDLFGGSGALAVEALSRGARQAWVVDQSPQSIRAIEMNLTAARLREKAQVRQMESLAFLRNYRGEPFDIVLLDPPYGKGLVQEAIELLLGCQLLSTCGIIICETDPADPLRENYQEWNQVRRKVYGKSALTVYQRQEAAE